MKIHVAVDSQGLPHALMVTTANVSDRDGALVMFSRYLAVSDVFRRVSKVLVDGGYSGDLFSSEVKRLVGAEVEVAKRSERHAFVVIPKRWVVERSFGWLDKYRRLWKNCERKLQNTFQRVTLAFIRLLLKRYYTGS